MEWMLLPFRRYAQFSGRSRRKEFWMFMLLNFIVMIVASGLIISGVGGAESMEQIALGAATGGPLAILGGIIWLVWFLAAFIPGIAVTVRRLHDRNMSGWWYLGFFLLSLIPFIGVIVSIGFLVVLVLDGTTGPNRFGDDPKGRLDSDVFS